MTTPPCAPVAVLGAGSWGTTLGVLLARNGVETRLWGHDPVHMAHLIEKRVNEDYLDGIAFPEGLHPTANLEDAIAGIEDILIVVPSTAFREVVGNIRTLAGKRKIRLAWASKGLDSTSGELLHHVVEEIFPDNTPPYAIVSGPTFAREVAEGLPAAVTIATRDVHFGEELSLRLHNAYFRVYTAQDIVGVAIGGATKNVYAIAAGIADGLGFGANTRAALITRGLHEIMRLGVAAGGSPETFMGLTGLGDLVLTCTDNQSRNRRFGLKLAQGEAAGQALSEIHQVVEGIEAARLVLPLARRIGVEMPIATEIHEILFHGKPPQEAVKDLLNRDRREEGH
ncbi:MAG: NAD(P)H-dependent glycerol-3-phosphate dehydrogenase [Gammaproteobacteria bacterium]|nr:NAD(P)H-dependent glycerol-3-phosphate dehydrogenase [Gammaproteobacteria bacterium]